MILFPESIDEYINEDNTVRIIEEYIEQLDMKELGFKKTVYPTIGRPPYDPKDILKLYLYGYLNRIRSSRRLEHEASRNIEAIWLLKKLKPDFKTIADCRKDNKKALSRSIFRHIDQNFLDTIDLQTELNKDKYKLRQMIVEHPFGTIKRSWGAYYFLTRRKISVTTEMAISFLTYNMKRAWIFTRSDVPMLPPILAFLDLSNYNVYIALVKEVKK